MSKVFTAAFICFILYAACKNNVNTYENTLGINPATLAGIDTANYTKIQWKDTIKNLNKIKEGDTVSINFKFKNTGNKALFILETIPSCGCTVADYPRGAILPGDQDVITAIFYSQGQPGKLRKSIMVKTNTINKIFQKLEISGEVFNDKQTTRK
ncbi:MAG: DUF1573 domain-containing protein [Chitinophagaceae bacterium]